MRNLKVFIAYNGTNYHGFQSQDGLPTVQGELERCIALLTREKVTVTGCSRTDAGVHARQFCFNVKIDSKIPCEGFQKGMNTVLPPDIAVLSCEGAPEDFHARFCSHEKEYVYLINNGKSRDVFTQNLALFYPYPLDEKRLYAASQLFVGEHDFGAYCKAEAKPHLETTVRTVNACRVVRNGDYVEFYVRGNGFLHNMVRIMTGTLLYIAEGKRTERDITASLDGGDRELAGKTAAPCGLYLNRVFYGE